ncbi:hypothetical protein BDF14DRAFT_1865983 [Spinellus fusiger]|nr:hypothetical protein BDF14DRAFT_1865983 [Spinellus fusiger]
MNSTRDTRRFSTFDMSPHAPKAKANTPSANEENFKLQKRLAQIRSRSCSMGTAPSGLRESLKASTQAAELESYAAIASELAKKKSSGLPRSVVTSVPSTKIKQGGHTLPNLKQAKNTANAKVVAAPRSRLPTSASVATSNTAQSSTRRTGATRTSSHTTKETLQCTTGDNKALKQPNTLKQKNRDSTHSDEFSYLTPNPKEDAIFDRNGEQERAFLLRRMSLPPLFDEETKEKIKAEEDSLSADQSFCQELNEIRSRLQKLEKIEKSFPKSPANKPLQRIDVVVTADDSSVHAPSTPMMSPQSTATYPTRSDPSTPSSPISSQSAEPRTNYLQKLLCTALDTYKQVTNKQRHHHQLSDTSVKLPAERLAEKMASIVSETVFINQMLWAALSQNDTIDLSLADSLEKSSDTQVRLLTDALHIMTETAYPSSPTVMRQSTMTRVRTFSFSDHEDRLSRPNSYSSYDASLPDTLPSSGSRHQTTKPNYMEEAIEPHYGKTAMETVVERSYPRQSTRPFPVAGIIDPHQYTRVHQHLHPNPHLPYHDTASATLIDSSSELSNYLYDSDSPVTSILSETRQRRSLQDRQFAPPNVSHHRMSGQSTSSATSYYQRPDECVQNLNSYHASNYHTGPTSPRVAKLLSRFGMLDNSPKQHHRYI